MTYKTVFLIAGVLFSSLAAAQNHSRPIPISLGGRAIEIDDLPENRFKNEMLTLGDSAKAKVLDKLRSFKLTEHDLNHLHIDKKSGGLFYVDEFEGDHSASFGSARPKAPVFMDPQFDSSTVFKLHSKPGSVNKIYLDFDGHILTNTAWNNIADVSQLRAKAYSRDGDYSTFSADERREIALIWHQVAEDYSPFDVDVTTELPTAWTKTMERVLITEAYDANGYPMPYAGIAAGVAFLDTWGNDYYDAYGNPTYTGYYKNALVYFDYSYNIAGVVSHEMGHVLGLLHDGLNGAEYYYANGAWSPIMGSIINAVCQWSKGDYKGATQTQDDLAVIASHIGYRTDDHDSTGANPTPLSITSSGLISATNPENDSTNSISVNKGVIEKNGDVDYFSFTIGEGSVNITATPAWDAFYDELGESGGNLDIKLALYNSRGSLVAEISPTGQTDATLNTSVAPGVYLLAVSATGDTTVPYSSYGSLGQYFLSGSVTTAPAAKNLTLTTKEDTAGSVSLSSSIAGGSLTYAVVAQPTYGTVAISGGTATYMPAANYFGSDSFTYFVTNSTGKTASATVTVTVTPVNDAPAASASFKGAGKKKKFSSGASDVEGDALSYFWDFGDGYTSGEANPKHNYNWPGVYVATLTVTDALGASTQSAVSFTINGCQRKIGGVATVCPVAYTDTSHSVQINLGPNEAGLAYSVKQSPKYGSVTISGNIAIYTPTPGYASKVRFTVTVTDSRGKRPKKAVLPVSLNVIA